MKITVIAGSPKGATSITMQYVEYLRTQLHEHEWRIEQVSSRIKKLERDRTAFDAVVAQVRDADVVLWAFPLYVLLVPAGTKRFVELVHERGATDAFAGKVAGSLSTSIHFHDNCAHDYIGAVSEDLGMRYMGAHSPEMDDLRDDAYRPTLLAYGRSLVDAATTSLAVPRTWAPLRHHRWDYRPEPVAAPVSTDGRRVAIVHDARPEDTSLAAMVRRLAESFAGDVDVINLHEVRIKGNCMGCLRCGQDWQCAWTGKDDYIEMVRQRLVPADLLIYAGSVVDRHLSARWRTFFDRGFFNTHTPIHQGKQMAFVVAGPLGQMGNLREVLVGYAQWQETNLVGLLSDEIGDSAALDEQLTGLASRMVTAAEAAYVQPFDFHGVGGLKIFRDDIFGKLRMVFQADHRYYRDNGYYDFPTWNWSQRLLGATLTLLFRWPRARREFEKRIKVLMTLPTARVVQREARAVAERTAGRSGPRRERRVRVPPRGRKSPAPPDEWDEGPQIVSSHKTAMHDLSCTKPANAL